MNKILIVEDEEILLNVLKNKLEKEGFAVSVAEDGEEGLRKIEEEKPDLVLLDILMPKMDGIEVLRHLQEKGILPSLPVIIVSNSGQPVEIEKAEEFGVRDYLVKAEFNPQEVIDKIRKYLPQNPENEKSEIKEEIEENSENTQERTQGINTGSFKILVVEDDKFLRDLMVQKIIKEGFEVIEAVDGESGLKLAIEKEPHIVLLDLILPGIGGFDVLKKIRGDSKIGNIPVIILSNLGQKDDMDKASSLGATDYLVKAHNTPGEILDRVKEILSKSYM